MRGANGNKILDDKYASVTVNKGSVNEIKFWKTQTLRNVLDTCNKLIVSMNIVL
jgi:hypothetical protein